jgi:hypothetical protein
MNKRLPAQKIAAIEWAIHSCNRTMQRIRENELLPDDIKQKQIESHESYLRTLFAIRKDLAKQVEI